MKLSSANASNLDKAKLLSSCKGFGLLWHSMTDLYGTCQADCPPGVQLKLSYVLCREQKS